VAAHRRRNAAAGGPGAFATGPAPVLTSFSVAVSATLISSQPRFALAVGRTPYLAEQPSAQVMFWPVASEPLRRFG